MISKFTRTTLFSKFTRPNQVTAFLDNQGIERMVWPACSPDLNPIEHLWDQLKRAVNARINQDNTLDDLRQFLQEECMAIPQRTVNTLINSMRRRLEVIEKRGGYTHYY